MPGYEKKVRDILRENGFRFLRRGKGDHDIWHSHDTNRTVSVDGEIKSRHTANDILKKAGLGKRL